MNRRRFLVATVATCALPTGASAATYRVTDVVVRPSRIVLARIATDMPGRIASIIRSRGSRGSGRPVRVLVELRTIDPFRLGERGVQRGIAVRYRVIDAATGRTLRASRFIERTRRRERDRFDPFDLRPLTRGTQEGELARRVAAQILREGL